ncbi:MAG: ImmA/IrrE family metallo-endopeptidase [Desulfovibrionaceae bacterium]|nr:ImmA/IrrE family metallo-endopeptidase [Desulfovibrionaceae bacterium]
MIQSKTYIAVPPGETIKEQLAYKNMPQEKFSEEMKLSPENTEKLLNGTIHLTSDMAYRLEYVLGIPKIFWENLEKIYRKTIYKALLENDAKIARKFPLKEMQKRHWIKKGRSKEEEDAKILRRYFEVDCISSMLSEKSFPIDSRCLKKKDSTDTALLTWAQQARIISRTINVSPISVQRLRDAIPDLRTLSLKTTTEFCPILLKELALCGIALVFLPHLPGSYLHALTFREKQKLVICLSAHGKDDDKFWFSLFHEIGHILNGDIDKKGARTEDDERKADEFARVTLIPDRDFTQFVNRILYGQ